MDKEKSLLRIATNLDTIKAHINRLKRAGYKVHALDVDMLRTKAIDLYDQILELDELTDRKQSDNLPDYKEQEVKPQIPKPEIKEEKPVVEIPTEPEEESVPEQIEEVSDVVIEDKPEENHQVEQMDDEPKEEELKEGEVAEVIKPHSEDAEEEKVSRATAYDLFSGSGDNAVAEKYTTSEEPSIAEKMQKSQIANIREAIGINEKFLFINELFNGDMNRYNKILDDINALTTKKGVDTYILEMKIQFQWADDNEAFIVFKDLLERKFQ